MTVPFCYVRNGFGEVIQEASLDACTAVNYRDARGLMTQQTDGRGEMTSRTYEVAGRLITENCPAAPAETVTYVYDDFTRSNYARGRVTSIDDQSDKTFCTTSWPLVILQHIQTRSIFLN